MGAETQGKHGRRGDHEQNFPLFAGEDVTCDVLNPVIGAQFHRAHHGVDKEEYGEEDCAHGKLAQAAKGKPSANSNRHRDVFPIVAGKEIVAGEGKEKATEIRLDIKPKEKADDGGAKHTDILEHFAQFKTLFGGFGAREFLSKKHDAIKNSRD